MFRLKFKLGCLRDLAARVLEDNRGYTYYVAHQIIANLNFGGALATRSLSDSTIAISFQNGARLQLTYENFDPRVCPYFKAAATDSNGQPLKVLHPDSESQEASATGIVFRDNHDALESIFKQVSRAKLSPPAPAATAPAVEAPST